MKIENWQRKPFKRSLKWDASCYEWFCKRDTHRNTTATCIKRLNWKKKIKYGEQDKQRIDYYSKIVYNRCVHSLWKIKIKRMQNYLLKNLLAEDITWVEA
jgi:hypothetical protein